MSPDRYVHAFRRAIEAPAGTRDRNLAAIEKRIAAGDVVDEEESDDDEPRDRVPMAPHGRWASALFTFKAVSLSIGLGVAGLGVVKVGAMTWSALAREDAPAVAPADEDAEDERSAPPRAKAERSAAPPVDTPAPTTAPSERSPVVAAEPAGVAATPEPGPPRSRTRVKTPPSDRLREEVDLMTRARTELDAGRHDAVLPLVAEHERRFPDGAMIEERRAWRAIAACSLRHEDARAQAQSFHDRHPRSSLAEKVRRACADRQTDPAARSD